MSYGRVILVTGGVRGIGRAIATRLAAPDTAVIVTHARPNSPGVAETLEILKAKAGAAEAQCWPAEDPKAGEYIEAIAARYGRLDVLVNNAGLTKDSLGVRLSDEDWRQVLEANLFGAFNCSRAAAKIMMKARRGRIISLSSVVAFCGNPGQANYAASKAGLVAMSKCLALELASRGVTVNTVAPGFIETDMTKALGEKVRAALLARIPLGSIGQPEDVAEAVAFLASDQSGYITGQTIHVNGGMYL
ncbi:MAG: 3-oxoacyl-[acyl-carrier-protein] reductase [Deltaproteobacteria bacterium]|jgi:3-oxoacyl-[acyl-carrier protein] reductase|nr:3-oxoacyl-[acyl-carrier-protein] reductase [Deltaproteobacteria bacterium]